MRAKIDRIELSIAVMVKKGERNNQERQDNGYRSISPEGCQTHIYPCTNHSTTGVPTEWQTDSMARFTAFKIEYETDQGKMRALIGESAGYYHRS